MLLGILERPRAWVDAGVDQSWYVDVEVVVDCSNQYSKRAGSVKK